MGKGKERDKPRNKFLRIKNKVMVTIGEVVGRMRKIGDGDSAVH